MTMDETVSQKLAAIETLPAPVSATDNAEAAAAAEAHAQEVAALDAPAEAAEEPSAKASKDETADAHEDETKDAPREKRTRKPVQRFSEPSVAKAAAPSVKEQLLKGNGTALKDIDEIEKAIKAISATEEIIAGIHQLLFGHSRKATKADILKFHGFAFESDKQRETVRGRIDKWTTEGLGVLAQVLHLDGAGEREAVAQRIMDFLEEPSADKIVSKTPLRRSSSRRSAKGDEAETPRKTPERKRKAKAAGIDDATEAPMAAFFAERRESVAATLGDQADAAAVDAELTKLWDALPQDEKDAFAAKAPVKTPAKKRGKADAEPRSGRKRTPRSKASQEEPSQDVAEAKEEPSQEEYAPAEPSQESVSVDKDEKMEDAAAPSEEVAEKPSEELVEKPSEELIPKPDEELIVKPSEEVVAKPDEELIVKPSEEVVEKPSEELIEKPSEELIVEPSEEVVEESKEASA